MQEDKKAFLLQFHLLAQLFHLFFTSSATLDMKDFHVNGDFPCSVFDKQIWQLSVLSKPQVDCQASPLLKDIFPYSQI